MKTLIIALLTLTGCKQTYTVGDVVRNERGCAYILIKGGKKSQFFYGPCDWQIGEIVKYKGL